jgi:hypothetical protein
MDEMIQGSYICSPVPTPGKASIDSPRDPLSRFARLPQNYFNFAPSALASFKMGMSGSAFFHKSKKVS